MQRRGFLVGLSALCSLGAVTFSWRYWHVTDQAAIIGIINRRLGYLRLDAAGVQRFAQDVVATRAISDQKLRALAAAGPLVARLPLPRDSSLTRDIDYGEDRLVTDYLLSTDFFMMGADPTRIVRYLRHYDPLQACGNPFSRLPSGA